jgi:predicted DNA-binding transcriptional regulator YafY
LLSSTEIILRVVSETTSSRLLTLLSLLQGRRDWPGSELADRLEVSGRTVRRDVERLRTLGYPVESMTGPAGGYQLRAGAAMPPLLLDDDEAIAIAVGLRTAAGGSVTGIEETAVRALVKLEQVLPSHLRRRVQALTSATQTLQVYGGPQVDPQCLTVLAAACRDHERARFAYTARDRAGTRSSTPAAAGTWSPTTAAAATGARSASTGSTSPRRPACASARASCRPRTRPRTWPRA